MPTVWSLDYVGEFLRAFVSSCFDSFHLSSVGQQQDNEADIIVQTSLTTTQVIVHVMPLQMHNSLLDK